jgi:hypothetical protein
MANLPEPVLRFIARYIDSAALLEVLLVLRGLPEKSWTVEEIARARLINDEMARSFLTKLSAAKLVRSEAEGFRYDPPAAVAPVIDEVAVLYGSRMHTVVAAIYGGDSKSATTLSDAFRIRRSKW